MRVAIIHDSLVEFGGAEQVLLALHELFPKADVYTAYANKTFVKTFLPGLDWSHVFPSWVNGTIIMKHGSLLQFFSPLVWRSFNLRNYDLVISVSGYFCSNLVLVPHRIHIQYILCPPKNIFGLEPPFPRQHLLGNNRILKGIYARRIRSGHHVIAISQHIKNTLQELFGIKAEIIYPPVNIPRVLPKRKKGKHFLIISRLDNLKSLEIAIEACNELRLPLKIVGDSPYSEHNKRLYSLAGPTVEFLGFRSDKEIARLYQEAIAFIFTAKNEDFGIAPVESMAHGVPVIGYYGGGLKETVVEGKTGRFFFEHTPEALMRVITTLDPKKFSSTVMYRHAKKYSKNQFKNTLDRYIASAVKGRVR